MKNFKNMVWSPSEYEKACFLAREVGEEALTRLDWMTLNPKRILDVGCGIGEQSHRLHTRYSDATIFALDFSPSMLSYARRGDSTLCYVCGEGEKLPFANQTIDLIFANFFLPWQEEIKTIFREWRRVLRADGIILFSALGPDTLKEWAHPAMIMPQFVDMHDVGDMLLHQGFADPVLDTDYFTITYRKRNQLLNELVAAGFLSPDAISIDEEAQQDSKWSLTCEIIYGHAFASHPVQTVDQDGSVKVPLTELHRHLTTMKNEKQR